MTSSTSRFRPSKPKPFPGTNEVLRESFGWRFIRRDFCGRTYYRYEHTHNGRTEVYPESEHRKTAYRLAKDKRTVPYLKGTLKFQFGLGVRSWWYYPATTHTRNGGFVQAFAFNHRPTQKQVDDSLTRWNSYNRTRTYIEYPNLAEGKREDGMLAGVKALQWCGTCLRSPTQRTPWQSHVMKVPHWRESDVVRGQAGIHAAWPTLEPGKLAGELYGGYYNPMNEKDVIVEVVGWGRCAVGDMGWRAENVMIKKVYAQTPYQVKQIAARYPEVEVVHRSQWGKDKDAA